MTSILLSLVLFWSCINLISAWGNLSYQRRDVVLLLVASMTLWVSTLVGTIHLIGDLHLLTRPILVGGVTLLSAGGFALAHVLCTGDELTFAARQRRLWTQVKTLPQSLLRAMKHSGWPLWTVVLFTFGVLGYFLFAAFVSPPRGNNDALFYHEPIVAFSLQHGHLGPFDLPNHLQRINGMPRFIHLLQLWFAAFHGRELVELPNIVGHALGALSTYGLMRHMRVQKSVAIGWALVWCLTPGMLRLTPGIMVDPMTGMLVAAATYLVIVPRLTSMTVLTGAMACSLTIGTKYHVLLVSFVLSLALLLRLVKAKKDFEAWPAKRWWVVTTCSALIVMLGLGLVFGRNVILFENPIWPAGVKIPGTDIKLKSAHDIKDAWSSNKGLGTAGILHQWTASPYTVDPWNGSSARPEDYGPAGVFIVWPMAMWATLLGLLGYVRLRRRRGGEHSWVEALVARGRAETVLLQTAIVVLALATFPSIVRGRYYLAVLGTWYALTAWLTSAPKKRALGRQVVFTAALLMMISTVWAYRIGMFPRPTEVWARLKVDKAERDFTLRQLSTVTPEMGAYRRDHFKAGTKVGFDSGFSIGVLWNDDYTNEVHWMKTRNPPIEAEKKDMDFLFLHTKTFSKNHWDDSHWEQRVTAVLNRKGRRPGRLYEHLEQAKPKPSPPEKKAEVAARKAPGVKATHKGQTEQASASEAGNADH